jgi:uncharacterized protein
MGPYHEGELEVQRRAGVTHNAERIGRSIHATIPPIAAAFARERSFVVIGGAGSEGRVWASLLRGAPGFLSVPADDRLHVAARLPDDDPLAAVLASSPNGEADLGLLLIDPSTRRRVRLNGRVRPEGRAGLVVTTREVYANCPKYIRPRASAIPSPTGPAQGRRGTWLSEDQMRRVAEADTLFLASRHPVAGADVSHRGGAPGFVHAPSPNRIVIPDYAGNTMFNTLGNITADPHAGVLLVDFETGATLQLSGIARILWDQEAVAAFEQAERLVELTVEAVISRP